MEPLQVEPSIYSGNEGGRCGLEEGVEDCLRDLAKAGNGRFHHFRVSGSCDSDDISELREEMAHAFEYLEEGRRILEDYREFCCRVNLKSAKIINAHLKACFPLSFAYSSILKLSFCYPTRQTVL